MRGQIKILAEIKTIVNDNGYVSIKDWLLKEEREDVYARIRRGITYDLKDWMGNDIEAIVLDEDLYTLNDVKLGADDPENVIRVLTEHEATLKNLLHGYLSIITKEGRNFEKAVIKMETLRYKAPERFAKIRDEDPRNYDIALYGLRNLLGIMDNAYVPGTELIVAENKEDDIPEFSTRGSKNINDRIIKRPKDWALLQVYYK